MAISYPITLPFSTKSASSVHFQPIVAAGVERSPYSLVENVQDASGRLLQAVVELPPMTRETGGQDWIGALRSLHGPVGTFYLGNTAWKVPLGVATGTPLVNGAGQTGSDLATDGWSPSVTGILKRGDMIQIGTGASARLYMLELDANSNGSGQATLTLYPSLRSSPADNAAIVTNSPVGVFRLQSAPGDQIDAQKLAQGLTFTAVEALNP